MVNPIIALAVVGGIIVALSKFGSPLSAFGVLGSDLVGGEQKSKQGEVTVDNLQDNPAIPTKQGSQTTIATIVGSEIIRTDVTSKRKFNQGSAKPMIKTTFFDPKSGGSRPQIGTTKTTNVSANFSNGAQFGTLTTEQVGAIRAQPFTDQELLDIASLTTRLQGKSDAVRKLKDTPQEVIFKKREQEALAKQVLGGSNYVYSGGITTTGGSLIEKKGGLFGKENFALGGMTPQQHAENRKMKDMEFAKIAQNKILNDQREITGQQIISTIQKSGLNQKQFLRGTGINLQGGDLNARAIAKLQERGFDFSSRPKEVAEKVAQSTPLKLTSAQVGALTDAEKIARFRSGNRFT